MAAQYVYELLAKIGLDDKEYQDKLLNAGQSMKNTDAEIVAEANKMKKGIGTAAAAGAAAIGAFAVSSVKTAGEFDTAMSQVAATLGTTTDNVGDLREKALEMGASTKYTAAEAAEGLNILAMSGYDATQSIAMIEDVLHLAAAGSMDMASAAGFISGAMKGFNDETKDSGYYADLMAKGATLANTSVSQLGEAMADSAAVAASYGQSADSVTVSLLRLAEQGEVGSAAGTALAAAMKNLYAPTDQAKKLMEELGVSAFDKTTGRARDFNTVVNELQASMADLTDEQRTEYAQTIFGIQGFNAYNKMIVTTVEKQNEWTAALEGSTGEAAKQYETMTDNLEGDIDKLKSAWEGLKIQIGEKLMPVARQLIQWLSGVIDKADEILPKVAAVVAAFGTFAVAINIASIIKKVTLAFQAFSALLVANPIAIIVAAIVGLIAYLVTLYNTNEEFREKVQKAWTSIKEFFSGIADWFKNAWETLKAAWEKFTGKLKEGGAELKKDWESLKSAFKNAWDWIKKEADASATYLKGKWEKIKNAYQEHGGGLKGIASATMEAIKQYYSIGWDAINTLTGGKLDAMRERIQNRIDRIKEYLQRFVDKVKNIFKFSWELPKLKLPHFTWSWTKLGKWVSVPNISVQWYKKAYESPYLFDRPTVLQGFGDGAGSEIVYGHQNLMSDIENSVVRAFSSLLQGVTGAAGGVRDVTVVLELDRQQMGKATFRLYNEAEQKYGVQLAGGIA